ncbi:coiled-coil domain-containing protein 24 [Brachyistius frenatus]|uniref:coiled-coil domain-containing protein 24 n=1 Tax=Brachyistius frenatus TaxID=100188 RepID=UPI0037E71B9C
MRIVETNLAISLLSNWNVYPGYHSFTEYKHKDPTQISTHMCSPDEGQPWCPGQSLWSLIAEHVSGTELPKICKALGPSLVGMYTEVHAEAEMLHKMWQESQRGENQGSRAEMPFPRQQGSPLADPPAVKELLRAEVKMLLQTLRERATRGGRDGEELLFQYKHEAVNYALGHRDSCYSNCTNPANTDNGSRPGSHDSGLSSGEDAIEAMSDKLNVTEIDQVVDRLRSVLSGECEKLTRLIKHLKGNFKHKCVFKKSEPSLAELRELRGAIQMDLELYPSSFEASSPLPVKGLKNSLSADTLQAVTPPSVLRPHPPPPLCHPKPRPPIGFPLTKTTLSKTHSQHRITSASNKSSKTPTCDRMDTSGNVNNLLVFDQIKVKSKYPCSFSPEQECIGLRPWIATSPIHKRHLSSHRSLQSPKAECDLSPQSERKCSPAWRSININITPPAPPLRDAGSFSSNRADYSVSATGKSRSHNGQENSSSGGSLGSSEVQTDHDGRTSTVMSETGSHPARDERNKSNRRIDRNISGDFRKDVSQQQSLSSHSLTDCSSHCPESSDTLGQAPHTQTPSEQIHGNGFTSPKNPHGGTASQPESGRDGKTAPQVLKRFHQPVPPARVPRVTANKTLGFKSLRTVFP